MRLSNQPINLRYILIVAIFAFAAGWLIIYQNTFEFPESEGIEVITKKKGAALDQETTELIRTESVICDNKIYIFDTVLMREKYSYFNDIYKTTRSPENFIVRLKAPTVGLDAFFVLAAPKENCDRVYLTTARYETSRPLKGIFEWRISGKEVRELAVSKELFGHMAPSYPRSLKDAVSPDGESMIVAQLDERLTTDKWSCDARILKLLYLRKDIKDTFVVIMELPKEEAFTISSGAGEEGHCWGIDFGWQNESTIYYDVYDAMVEAKRPLLERRTLPISEKGVRNLFELGYCSIFQNGPENFL